MERKRPAGVTIFGAVIIIALFLISSLALAEEKKTNPDNAISTTDVTGVKKNTIEYSFFYFLTLYLKNNDMTANILLINQKASYDTKEHGEYTLKIISFDNGTLYSTKVSFISARCYTAPRDWFDKDGKQIVVPNESPIVMERLTEVNLRIPYYPNGKNITVFDNTNSPVLTIDISHYNDLDRDGILFN